MTTISTNCRKCKKVYSVEYQGKLSSLLKAEAELDQKLKQCSCNITKPKGFNEEESTKL